MVLRQKVESFMVIKCLRYVPADNMGFAVFHPPMIIISFVSKPERSCLLIFVLLRYTKAVTSFCWSTAAQQGSKSHIDTRHPTERNSDKITKTRPWWPGIAQSVQRLVTGWTVRASNPAVGRDFPHHSRPALGPTQPPIQWVPGLSRGVKRPGRGVDHPPYLAPRLKQE